MGLLKMPYGLSGNEYLTPYKKKLVKHLSLIDIFKNKLVNCFYLNIQFMLFIKFGQTPGQPFINHKGIFGQPLMLYKGVNGESRHSL